MSPARVESAAIVAVGSELLTPFRLDTNSLFLTARLNALGIDVREKAVVGDGASDLTRALQHAMSLADLVVMTGGLGPTADDRTREVVAQVLGLSLEEDRRIIDRMEARFAARGMAMPAVNRRQAMVPRGAQVIENRNGTAPGLVIDAPPRLVVLLPGPPRELQPMMQELADRVLAARTGARRLLTRILRVAGRPESYVEERAYPVYSRWMSAPAPIETTILASPGQIELHLRTWAHEEPAAQAALDRAVGELRDVLGDDLFTVDGLRLEEVVGLELRRRGWRVALAESCTGGLVTSRLTDVPGSSDYVEVGLVTYSNQAKRTLLGVSDQLLEAQGAVSEPVALAMAMGARARAGAETGIGITGIAGPTGATTTKPVGMVCVAVVAPPDRQRVRTYQLPGEREAVKAQASQVALDMLRRLLVATPDDG